MSSFFLVLSTWCATGRPDSALPWRRSTSRICYWGTRFSRRLWRGTSSPLQKTPLSSPCSAPLKHGGTSAWSWNMLKVMQPFVISLYCDFSHHLRSFCVLRWRLCHFVEEHRGSACGAGTDVFCWDRVSPGVSAQLWHRPQRPQTRQVSV